MTAPARSALLLGAAAAAGIASVAPPLDTLADRSFAWHMLQHLVVLYAVAALIVAANPFVLLVRFAGKRTVARLVRATRPLHAAAVPWVALPAFVEVLWITHFSPLYELALERPWVHVAEHLCYLVAGIAFWLPVLSPAPLRPQSHPARILYLLLALPQGALLGMVLFAARAPLYEHYRRAAGSFAAALADQHAAAALMWMGGGIVILSALLLTLAGWARREGERQISSSSHARLRSVRFG